MKTRGKKAKSWRCLSITSELRKKLDGLAVNENRSVPGMIAEAVGFWIRLHCPECGNEVLSGTCACKKPGV